MALSQANIANNDDVIISHLELQRKALAESAQFIDNKAWWVFLATNTASAAIVTGHVYVIQRGNHHFAIGFVFFLILYAGILKLFSEIVEPKKYIGGTINWNDAAIGEWRKLPPDKLAPQLISQYRVACDDMGKRLDDKADRLDLCLRVLNVLLFVVGAEAAIYIWLGAP